MSLNELAQKARQIFFDNPERRKNWGTETKPEWAPYNYIDISDDIAQDLDLDALIEAITDLKNYSDVEQDGFHTAGIGDSVHDAYTFIDVLREIVAGFIAQQLGADQAVVEENKRRNDQFEAATSK